MSSIIYPIFEQASELANDTYWKEILHRCACGKFPRKVAYNSQNHSITIHKGEGDIPVVALPQKAPQVLNVLLEIFKDIGLESKEDISKIKLATQKQKEKCSINLDCKWTEIKKKNTRQRLLFNYEESLRKKYNLSNKEFKQLHSVLTLGFQFKALNSDDIIYKNGKIIKIKNLKYKKGEGFYTTRKPKISKTAEKSKKHPFIEGFIKYHKKIVKEKIE